MIKMQSPLFDKRPPLERYFFSLTDKDLPIIANLLEKGDSHLDQWGEHKIQIAGYSGFLKIQEITNKIFPSFEEIISDSPRIAKRIYLIKIWHILSNFFEKNLEKAKENTQQRNYSRFNIQRKPVDKLLTTSIEEIFNKKTEHPIKEALYLFKEQEFFKRWGKSKVSETMFLVEKKELLYKATLKMMEEALLKDSFEKIAQSATD